MMTMEGIVEISKPQIAFFHTITKGGSICGYAEWNVDLKAWVFQPKAGTVFRPVTLIEIYNLISPLEPIESSSYSIVAAPEEKQP